MWRERGVRGRRSGGKGRGELGEEVEGKGWGIRGRGSGGKGRGE